MQNFVTIFALIIWAFPCCYKLYVNDTYQLGIFLLHIYTMIYLYNFFTGEHFRFSSLPLLVIIVNIFVKSGISVFKIISLELIFRSWIAELIDTNFKVPSNIYIVIQHSVVSIKKIFRNFIRENNTLLQFKFVFC